MTLMILYICARVCVCDCAYQLSTIIIAFHEKNPQLLYTAAWRERQKGYNYIINSYTQGNLQIVLNFFIRGKTPNSINWRTADVDLISLRAAFASLLFCCWLPVKKPTSFNFIFEGC